MGQFKFEQYVNCFDGCMVQLFQKIKRNDILEIITKPIGFQFDISLGTRDWWLGGYSEATFRHPTFCRGISGKWISCKESEFEKKIKEKIKNGNVIVFRTEWTFIPYSSLYGHSLGDIHTAMILDCNENNNLTIYDRMGYRRPDIFNNENIGVINLDVLKEAFTNRFEIFEYSVKESVLSWEEELRELLKRSIDSMEQNENCDNFDPHLHKATGIPGMKYFFKVIKHSQVEFRNDRQTKMLIYIRIPDTANYVIGNRMFLKMALEDKRTLKIFNEKSLYNLIKALEDGICAWENVKNAFLQAARNSGNDYSCIESASKDCIHYEYEILKKIKILIQEEYKMEGLLQ